MSFDPNLCRNESEVESKLIVQYLLPRLGYTPDTWHQEVAFGKIRLDFLAFAQQNLIKQNANSLLGVVIEAKHPKQKLEHHLRKFRRYLTSLGASYGLLTNAKEIRIYRRVDDEIELIFCCSGQQLEQNLEQIGALIGRNSLNKPSFPTLATKTALKVTEVKQTIMKTIAIYHHKGGVGKTTISINLAAALRKKGKRVLLIDIDAQANTTFATGLIKFIFEEEDNLKDCNVSHLLESKYNSISEIAKKSNYFNQPEIDVVPSHISLIDKQAKLSQLDSEKTSLFKKLEQVNTEYDVVIIDAPPSLDLYAQAALTAADYLIIPSDLKPYSNQGLKSVQNFVEQVNNIQKKGLGKPPIQIMGVLPSKISTHAKYLTHTFPKHKSVVPEHYNLPLMENMISERIHLSHCINQTVSVGELEVPDPKSIFDYAERVSAADVSAAEFEALAIEVLEKMEQ